ncbi:MAG: SRPBCC family protein [Spongiibacter sp.]|uniref:SRPBCC family protein n=1 Tax=Spongiibacter thalassae TaxID=2721624 RepID=A0ABX1GD78_9GAMM|nr:SRPBCC family protein [Spongiibacter sp.]NKI17125.1 SRPBCC family protein [Spongiibacter thalassae]
MAKKYPCTPVDMTFFERVAFCYVAEEVFDVSAARVFASFENADDWPRWAPPIQRVEWTSPQPFGMGTTRTVHMVGGLVGYEEFIAWERGREMAFCFVACSKDYIESFAERYEVEELAADRCRVRWSMAMKPKGFSRYFLPLFSPVMTVGVKYMLKNLKNYVENSAKG